MYTKSWKNRQSNDQGRLFENLIDQGCIYYQHKDIAMIEKTPEPFRVKKINKDGSMTVYPIGKAQPDYRGVSADTFRHVLANGVENIIHQLRVKGVSMIVHPESK